MYTLLLILAVSLATFGMASFLAGCISLAVPTEEERFEAESRYQRERKKGFFHAQIDGGPQSNAWTKSQCWRSHWGERPQSRCLVYIGLSCIFGCVAVGLILGALG